MPLCVLPSGLWRLGAVVGSLTGWYGVGALERSEDLYMLLLTAVAEGLALLTLGLVRPWGEVVPRWVPVLGGRTVPPAAAVVPAALGVAALAGIIAYTVLNAYVTHLRPTALIAPDSTAALPSGGALVLLVVCYAPLAAWAPLLTAVTVAYRRRRTVRTSRALVRHPGR